MSKKSNLFFTLDTTNEAATKDLMAELHLLKLIPQHQNVVGLLGCCSYADPLYVIVEYCSNGDLQGFLRSSRGIYERYYRTSYGGAVPNLTCKMLLTFACQIAKGMNHLSSMKVSTIYFFTTLQKMFSQPLNNVKGFVGIIKEGKKC